jgi:8-oxo-dGTP diphosphatase
VTELPSERFSGAKIALLIGERVIAYKRDDKPGIPYPGMWDLPGGGREGEESPEACVLREVEEEFGLTLSAAGFCWKRSYPGVIDPTLTSWFFVSRLAPAVIDDVVFGSEGERWELMEVSKFLAHPGATPQLKQRLADFLASEDG